MCRQHIPMTSNCSKSPLAAAVAAAALTAALHAGETVRTTDYAQTSYTPAPASSLYNAGEWQIDLFGNYAFRGHDDRRLFDDDGWGGGIAFNYFFNRNFGLGVEGSLFDTYGDTLGTAGLDLFWRFPIAETGLAPYVFGGVGLTFNADDLSSGDFRDARHRWEDGDDPRDGDDVIFLGHAGAGLEYRFTPHFGIFTDARYTWTEHRDGDYGQARAGVRFAF